MSAATEPTDQRDTYYRLSRDEKLHRCLTCWAHLGPVGGPVFDNGFMPAEKPYPHARWCSERGKF